MNKTDATVLNGYVQRAFETSTASGFHKEYHPDQHWLMLVITEICEAVEADRKNKYVHLSPDTMSAFENAANVSDEAFKTEFEAWIKNRVEDELADVVIRLCDYAGTTGIELKESSVYADHDYFVNLTFTETAYDLTKHLIFDASFLDAMDHILPDIIQYVYDWADYLGADLDWYIHQKMRYNEMRSQMHGKKY